MCKAFKIRALKELTGLAAAQRLLLKRGSKGMKPKNRRADVSSRMRHPRLHKAELRLSQRALTDVLSAGLAILHCYQDGESHAVSLQVTFLGGLSTSAMYQYTRTCGVLWRCGPGCPSAPENSTACHFGLRRSVNSMSLGISRQGGASQTSTDT